MGGIIYLSALLLQPLINKVVAGKWLRCAGQFGLFILLYCLATFAIVPIIARPLGRVPLPLSATNNVKPLHFFTCLLNRHYVRTQLKEAIFAVGSQMNEKFPGTTINYLDAGFPFFNGFPLLPHLSHNDGRKVDVSFCYTDARTGAQTNEVPSPIGYGISEEPRPDEVSTTQYCASCGYKYYGALNRVVPQRNNDKFLFDAVRTKELVSLFAAQPAIGKLFIEPHLKARLRLTSPKIRFQGCHAIRHDDHLHVQL